jgi:Kef-type K+ transport system membrane component KefB
MLHVPPLVSTIAIGLVLAFAFGVLAHRFKLPPLVGYLVAGIVIGPFTPGFVADGEVGQGNSADAEVFDNEVYLDGSQPSSVLFSAAAVGVSVRAGGLGG